MENITLADVALVITFLTGLFGGIGYLSKCVKKWIEKALDDQFKKINADMEKINEDMQEINKKTDRIDMESCKNFLVQCLDKFEKENNISEIAKERFWEQYEHYANKGGNSYIMNKVENLQRDGKL